MFPVAHNQFVARELPQEIPDALRRSFISTADAFSSRNFVATAVCCRRTLEGIVKYLLPESERGKTLAHMIEMATKSVDLTKPLRTLAHAIRDGGNLGAHFDEDNEPTEQVARQMVELLDYLITYLHVLPKQIDSLERSLERSA